MSNLNKPSSGGPAFPMAMPTAEGVGVVYGMTLREYAAIKLRVPESGTDWLDEMIRQSVRDELAAKVMQGFAAANDGFSSLEIMAAFAHKWADAMLRAKGAA